MTTDTTEPVIAHLGTSATARTSDTPALAAIRRQLMRRDRKTGMLLTPAKFDFQFGHDRQQTAISMLFAMSHTIAEHSGLIMTRREFELTRTQLQAQADALREVITTTARLALRKPWSDDVDPVAAAIREIEERLVRLERKTVVVERDRGELTTQGVCIHISQLCCQIFGAPLPGIVAALASVLLDTAVEKHSVRNWWAAFTAEQ